MAVPVTDRETVNGFDVLPDRDTVNTPFWFPTKDAVGEVVTTVTTGVFGGVGIEPPLKYASPEPYAGIVVGSAASGVNVVPPLRILIWLIVPVKPALSVTFNHQFRDELGGQ